MTGREIYTLEAVGNLGAAIDQRRQLIRAPKGKDVGRREPRHEPRLSSCNRVDEVFAFRSARQKVLPVAREQTVAGVFWSHWCRRPAEFLHVEASAFPGLIA